MKERGVTETDLACEMGVRTGVLRGWLSGEVSPTLENVELMGKSLAVPLVEFFAGQGKVSPDAHTCYQDCLNVVVRMARTG